jgi:hypothetical protein
MTFLAAAFGMRMVVSVLVTVKGHDERRTMAVARSKSRADDSQDLARFCMPLIYI